MNPWFKFYGSEFLSDPKIASFTPIERSCWVVLLCLASASSTPGVIEFLTVEVLLQKSGVVWDPYHPEEWNSALGILKKFEKMKMIALSEEGSITVCNWQKRQDSNLSNAERQARFRAKNKESNAPRYESNARIEKNRIEKNINTPGDAGIYTKEFEQLWKRYPRKVGKGAAFKAWKNSKAEVERVLKSIAQQERSEQWQREGGRFIPHLSTWLNQRRWEDEVEIKNNPETYVV